LVSSATVYGNQDRAILGWVPTSRAYKPLRK